ncbi:MAG: alpha/beta hydrolase [Propioniciclava sp.]|uniref:alpha/beta fold hydrolase n=1 Tax=Propioniciclava sp. TaxID=2038686 RepID=UPI0039E5CF6C
MSARRHVSREEVRYKRRYIGTVEYHTSRSGYDDASLVAYRFPCQVPQKSGPDFVLVHGIGVSARSYGPTAVELAKRGDVHLIDMAGYGRSPRPDRDLTIEDHAALIARYLKDKELDHPVVVGHSMGTQVVAELAAAHPEELDHIVLIAPVVVPSARELPKVAALLLANGLKEPPKVSAIAIYDYVVRAGIPYMIKQTPHVLGTDLEEIAGRVHAKTLVICGEDDPIVPVEWGRQLASEFREGWFATVPGPHATMFAAPEKVAALINEHAYR